MLTRYRISPWLDSLLLPVYVGVISGLMFFLQAVANAFSKGSLAEGASLSAESQSPGPRRFRHVLENLGGGTIFAYKAVQLLMILGLLGISSVQLTLQNAASNVSNEVLGTTQVVQFAQCALYVSHHDS